MTDSSNCKHDYDLVVCRKCGCNKNSGYGVIRFHIKNCSMNKGRNIG